MASATYPPPVPGGVQATPQDPNKSLIVWGWILLGGAVISAGVPVLNVFAILIGGALVSAAMIMAIILLARGRTGVGVAMLLTSMIGAPITMVILFFASNLIFAAGVAASSEGFPTPPPVMRTER